jgi:dihydropteroate synthase
MQTKIMGVLNVTPDSFSDGGQYFNSVDAIQGAQRLIEQGVDIIDVGGESTRPNADPVSVVDEIQRILKYCPPSENESGVTFNTPIIFVCIVIND